jgi:hypothetical protein
VIAMTSFYSSPSKRLRLVKLFYRSLAIGILLAGALAGSSRAEVFLLHDGGQVRGELVNRDQSPRKTFVIKTVSGGQVTLDAAQVKTVRRQSASEIKYDHIKASYPDTIDGQWKLSEWCRDNGLSTQRKVHLERILELDPDHAAARHLLGYMHTHGRWMTQEMLMTERGYLRYKGRWVLPQEMEILEQQRKENLAQAEWTGKLKRWHGWLATDKAEQAEGFIRGIDDPFAVRPLIKYLDSDDHRGLRMMYVEVLGKLNVPLAMEALIDASLADGDEEIRLACLDQVVSHQYKPAVSRYVKALKSKDNATINRAAICLAHTKDPSAIAPLIDVLVTIHSYTIQRGTPGGIGASFGRGPGGSFGGLTAGSSVETINQRVENRGVLQSLVDLTGGVSYNFDIGTWKNWYASQKKPQSLDARRDNEPK